MFLAFIFVGLCFGERRLLQAGPPPNGDDDDSAESSGPTILPPTAEQQMSALITSQQLDVNEGLFVKCYIYHNYLNPESDFWLDSGSNLDTPMSDHIAAEPWYVQVSQQMNQAPFSEVTVAAVENEFSVYCADSSPTLFQQVRTTLNCAIQPPGVSMCPQTPEEWVLLVPECATALGQLANGGDPGLDVQEKMQCARIILGTIFVGGIVDLGLYQLQQTAQDLLDMAEVNTNAMMALQQEMTGNAMLIALGQLNAAMGLGESFVQAAIASEQIEFTLQNFNLCTILNIAGIPSTSCPAGARL